MVVILAMLAIYLATTTRKHKRVRWLDIPADMRKRFETWGKESAQ